MMMRVRTSNYANFVYNLNVFLLFTAVVNGYPTLKPEVNAQPDEKTFPNGTIIGKYAYVDKDGNPIQVKYYADESSYGVELNSIKVLSNKEKTEPTVQPEKQFKSGNSMKNDPVETNQYDVLESFKYPVPAKKYNKHEPLDFLNKETTPIHQKNKYKNPEYEVYTQNDLNAPNKQCGADNEKVLVYNFNKDSGNVPATLDELDDGPKFCERF